MKILSLAPYFFFFHKQQVQASSLEELAQLYEESLLNAQNNSTDVVASLDDPGLRNVNANNVDIIDNSVVMQLRQYGCWCYFGNNWGKGRSIPQDGLDSICKVLHQGYECARMDNEAEGYVASGVCPEPWDQRYKSNFRFLDPNIDLKRQCQKMNSAKKGPDFVCAQRACMVEGQFLQNLLAYFSDSKNKVNKSVQHKNGFDPNTECVVQGGGDPGKECCGDYPIRFPYRTRLGDRGCCQGRTFNTLALSCCVDGTTKVTCT